MKPLSAKIIYHSLQKVGFSLSLFIATASMPNLAASESRDAFSNQPDCHGAALGDIKIRTLQDLQAIEVLQEGKVAHLCNDISLSSLTDFEPVLPVVKGTLKGHNHKLYDLSIHGQVGVGQGNCSLISVVRDTGTIEDLRLENFEIIDTNRCFAAASLVHYNYGQLRNISVINLKIDRAADIIGGISIFNYGRIDNSSVSGQMISAGLYESEVGGIATIVSGGSIINSYFSGAVEGQEAAGIAGRASGATIDRAKVIGSVTCTRIGCGGIVGWASNSTLQRISLEGALNCAPGSACGGAVSAMSNSLLKEAAVRATISASDTALIGGLVGMDTSYNAPSIRNSYAKGLIKISCQNALPTIGGIVSEMHGDYRHSYAAMRIETTNCAEITAGGVTGRKFPGAQTFRLYDIPAISGVAHNSVGASLTASQASSPLIWQQGGFDQSIWEFPSGNNLLGLPTLQWEQ